MNWSQWISAVLGIAQSRGIDVAVTYPGPGLATFTWACRNGANHGIAGAGASMIALTTPEAFTALWTCEYQPVRAGYQYQETESHAGRAVPRVPALATSDALRALFRM